MAHHRAEGYVFKKLAVVSKGIVAQHVVVVRDAAWHLSDNRVLAGDDKDLTECKLHSFAQRILAGKRGIPEGLLKILVPTRLQKQCLIANGIPRGACRLGVEYDLPLRIRLVQSVRNGKLLAEPRVVANHGKVVDIRLRTAKGRLHQEP